jgi:hypothetical protein
VVIKILGPLKKIFKGQLEQIKQVSAAALTAEQKAEAAEQKRLNDLS